MPKNTFAVIFDMDGVIVNNLDYHKRAWQAFFSRRGIQFTDQEFDQKMNGQTGREILETFLKIKLTTAKVAACLNEKERLYRRLYRPRLKAVPGVVALLKKLTEAKIKIALATAAPAANVRFILNGTKTAGYFNKIVDAERVRRGKPSPEIFLKASRKLKVPSKHCVVIEDGPLGILAAKRAKMKVVGIATTYPANKLRHSRPDLLIKNFNSLKLSALANLF